MEICPWFRTRITFSLLSKGTRLGERYVDQGFYFCSQQHQLLFAVIGKFSFQNSNFILEIERWIRRRTRRPIQLAERLRPGAAYTRCRKFFLPRHLKKNVDSKTQKKGREVRQVKREGPTGKKRAAKEWPLRKKHSEDRKTEAPGLKGFKNGRKKVSDQIGNVRNSGFLPSA